MNEYIHQDARRSNIPLDIDHRFFSALLSIWVAIVFKINALNFWILILILISLTLLALWMKISISISLRFIYRLIVYGVPIAISYVISTVLAYNLVNYYTSDELSVLRYLFPSIVAFWLFSTEINRQIGRIGRDLKVFQDMLDE